MGFSYFYINSKNGDNLTFASYLHMLHLYQHLSNQTKWCWTFWLTNHNQEEGKSCSWKQISFVYLLSNDLFSPFSSAALLTYILEVRLQFCSKVTTTLSDLVVYLICQGSAINKSSSSSSPSRHTLIHEFGDLDMPLAVAQLGHVQEHPQDLQWNLSSPVELQWNLKRAPVRMELKFSSGTPVNPLPELDFF